MCLNLIRKSDIQYSVPKFFPYIRVVSWCKVRESSTKGIAHTHTHTHTHTYIYIYIY